jgi:hypothetical protein
MLQTFIVDFVIRQNHPGLHSDNGRIANCRERPLAGLRASDVRPIARDSGRQLNLVGQGGFDPAVPHAH